MPNYMYILVMIVQSFLLLVITSYGQRYYELSLLWPPTWIMVAAGRFVLVRTFCFSSFSSPSLGGLLGLAVCGPYRKFRATQLSFSSWYCVFIFKTSVYNEITAHANTGIQAIFFLGGPEPSLPEKNLDSTRKNSYANLQNYFARLTHPVIISKKSRISGTLFH